MNKKKNIKIEVNSETLRIKRLKKPPEIINLVALDLMTVRINLSHSSTKYVKRWDSEYLSEYYMKYRNICIITKQLNIVNDENKTLLLWENYMNFSYNFVKKLSHHIFSKT